MGKQTFEIIEPSIRKAIYYRILNLSFAISIGLLISYSIAIINAMRYSHSIYINSSIISASIIFFFILIESLGFISRKIDRRLNWNENLKKRYWIQIFILTPYSILFGIAGSLFVSVVIAKDKFFDGFEIVSFLIIGLIISLLYSNIQLIYHYRKRKRFSYLNKLKFEKEDVEVKFRGLKDQLSPHFLFNNLHTLNSLISENPKMASDFVIKLSDIYRYVLQTKEKEIVTLKYEIEFIEKYLSLMKIRYGSNLSTNFSVNIDFENFYLPPLTLQILIENVQKHNFIDEDKPVKIDLYNENEEFFIVKNNLNKPIKKTITLHTGLLNLKSRYKYLSNKEVEILSTDSTFIVKVPLIQIK